MSVVAARVRAILRDSSDRKIFKTGVVCMASFQDAICMVTGIR